MKRQQSVLLTRTVFAMTLLCSSVALADGDGEEGVETGDEFAPDWADPNYAAKLSQSQAASLVRAAGIAVSSSGGCTNRNNSTCTSFEQINDATINGIITFKRGSGCAITITGGSETGHASGTYSHWNGYKVDIAFTSCVDSYIYNNFTYQGKRGDGAPLYKSAAGNLYARESSHWDITYF